MPRKSKKQLAAEAAAEIEKRGNELHQSPPNGNYRHLYVDAGYPETISHLCMAMCESGKPAGMHVQFLPESCLFEINFDQLVEIDNRYLSNYDRQCIKFKLKDMAKMVFERIDKDHIAISLKNP